MAVKQMEVRMNSKKQLVRREREEFYELLEELLYGAESEKLTTSEKERLSVIFRDKKSDMDNLIIAFQAIRNCYSPLETKEILETEFKRYFLRAPKDSGIGGENDAQRLIRFIFDSSHTSTLEHLHFTFHIEGASRAFLAQITRHRHMSFSVKSQRYVKFSTDSKSGGMDYIVPPTVTAKGMEKVYHQFMQDSQEMYDLLADAGVPQEDARFALPNSATTTLVMSCNLASALDFYKKRKKQSGAQWEIAEMAEQMRKEIELEEPWTSYFFNKL